MTVVDYLLEGLEAELELERELGVRTLECDRALLAPARTCPGAPASVAAEPPEVRAPVSPASSVVAPPSSSSYPIVFLHDRPLSGQGVSMMAKIIQAMGLAPETAPIIFEGERPLAQVYVVLGAKALRRWFPAAHGAPGQWIAQADAPRILVTYSPEYILRFGPVTPSVLEIKRKMWSSLKTALRRLSPAGE